MANLSSKVVEYCKSNGVNSVDFLEQVLLQDNSDGAGPFIAEWNLDIAQPTDEQLASYETAANTAESNAQVIATRKSLYGSNEQQIANIIENGLEAEQARVAQIKADNPKS